jgi:hypothetical protein
VARPLDASTYEADPCISLTDTQQQAFGIDLAEPIDISTDGNECNFHRSADGSPEPIWVVFPSKIEIGLSAEYAEYAVGAWDRWEPTKANGYPAVAFGDYKRPSHCSFGVGISDQLYYFVSADTVPGEELCETARNVATTILENIRTTE